MLLFYMLISRLSIRVVESYVTSRIFYNNNNTPFVANSLCIQDTFLPS